MKEKARETLANELLSWPGVTQQPHRFGGTEFVYGKKEIGHIHGDHLVDLVLKKSLRDEVLAAGQAKPHHVYPESNWVSIYLESEENIQQAIKILRLKYDDLVERSRAKNEPV